MKKILAYIRFLVFTGATLGIYGVWFITSFLIPNKQYWRQLAFELWARSFVVIARMKIEIVGTPPKPPFFLVSNHLSYVDVAALRAVVNGVFVAKHEISTWFVAGRIIRDMGAIFIDRTNRRDIPRAGKAIINRIDAGEGVIIFPEGTSTKGEEILPFHSSFLAFASNADLPVCYASISYKTPEGHPHASEMVCWWDDTEFLTHLLRLFTLPGFTAVITFGKEPIQNADRKLLAADLWSKVNEKFVPVV